MSPPDIAWRGGNVKIYGTRNFDNRDSEQMYEYMEARIEVLKRRVLELEGEIETLRWREIAEQHSRCDVTYAATA
jgi:hypothetical protein